MPHQGWGQAQQMSPPPPPQQQQGFDGSRPPRGGRGGDAQQGQGGNNRGERNGNSSRGGADFGNRLSVPDKLLKDESGRALKRGQFFKTTMCKYFLHGQCD